MLVDASGTILRLIVERDPYFNEPDGKKYNVSGIGYAGSVHDSLDAAKAIAESSLP